MLSLANPDVVHNVCGCVSEVARCPRCDTWSPRNEIRGRRFWEANLFEASVVEVLYGCYICPACPKGKCWFVVIPWQYETTRQYAVTSQSFVLELVRKHRMSVEGAAAVGRQIFHLPKLDSSTVLTWLRESGETVDLASHLETAVVAFSGELAVDEVYEANITC